MLKSDFGQRCKRLIIHQQTPRYASSGKPVRTISNTFKKSIEEFSFVSADQVGSGLTSKVYKGTNDQTGETICVKMIDMRKQECARFRDMLKSEITLLQQLRHPNIIEFKQVYHTSNNCYIITEYCNRGDVAGYLKNQLTLAEREALGLLRDLLSAYKYLVSKNILHRDIKPANTFLAADGTLKLADFGFAIRTEDSQLSKVNVGSPVYMAPECLEKSQYSFKSDIFAIGVFYYELLHGYTPWPCRSQEELLRRINSQPLKFNKNSSFSQMSKDFISKCLKINKNDRINQKQIFSHPLIATSKRSSGTTAASDQLDNTKDSQLMIDEYQLKPFPKRIKQKKKKKVSENIAGNKTKIISQRPKSLQSTEQLTGGTDYMRERKISIQESLKNVMNKHYTRKESGGSLNSRKMEHVSSVPSLTIAQNNPQPMIRRISRQITSERHRINSQMVSPMSNHFRQERLQPSLYQPRRVEISIQNQIKVAAILQRTFRLIHTLKDKYYFKRLLDKIAFLICRIDQLLNCSRDWHSFSLDEDDPYLKSVLRETNLKEVCRVGDFYFRRMIRMLNQSLMSRREGTPQNRRDSLNTLVTLTSLINRIHSVIDCVINNQEIIMAETSRAKLHS